MSDLATMMYEDVDSPAGRLRLVADRSALLAVLWEADVERPGRVAWAEAARPLAEALAAGSGAAAVRAGGRDSEADGAAAALIARARSQLAEYFAGLREGFELPLAPRGTPFQLAVWELLRAIPYGATRSYGELAAELGKPGAARAVGAAVGRNPLSVVVPCHRVLGSLGAMTGFAGGLEAKRLLLALEGRGAALRAARGEGI